MDEQHAQGTAMAMVLPNVLNTLLHYARHRRLDMKVALGLIAGAMPLTFVAAHLAVQLPSSPLRRAFALFIFGIAVLYVWQSLTARRDAPARGERLERWPLAVPIGAIAGFISGLFAVGGAIFAVPLMVFAFGFSQAVAQGLSLTLVAPGLIVALGTYAVAGDVEWFTGLLLAAGGLVTIRYGVALAYKLSERRLRLLFATMCALSAVGLWLRA
jgi:uncharacterized membrane protein YfcA